MPISAHDPHPRQRVAVLDSDMTYVDVGEGHAVVFLHGNPTSSYLWRNVIPHVAPHARCLAPDLIGMGESGKNPAGSYRFLDHARYLDAWFDAVLPEGPVTLVVHDWGSGLGFYWAQRNADRVAGIVFMECIVPMAWSDWDERTASAFQGFRSEAGEAMVLEKNMFVERVLPTAIIRELTAEEHDVYRKPYLEAGESRRPTLAWPRELPVDGEPADMWAICNAYSEFMDIAPFPKLWIKGEPGALPLEGVVNEWFDVSTVTVKGIHFLQEDSPDEIGTAVAEFIAGYDN